MTCGKWFLGLAVVSGTLACGYGTMQAQSPPAAGRPGREQLPQPVYRVAQQAPGAAAAVAANSTGALPQNGPAPVGEHPLVPALQMAYSAMANIQANVKDYSCTMVKRERIDGKLNDPEFMHMRLRHEPFSVYLYFLGPEKLRGQEVLYVAGKNNGNLIGHAGSGIKKIAGAVQLAPTSMLAMAGQRYPITEIGFLNLAKRLVEVGEQDKMYGECDVKFYKGAKINKRSAMCIQVVHPVPRKNFRFHKALIFVDDELNVPVRYESYDWPEKPGGAPVLLEEYTYTDIKINNGFTDQTFDEYNTEYHFH